MIFAAPCPECGTERKFIEFKVEACSPGTINAPESQYGFRCMGCKSILPTITDKTGREHRWTEGKHVES